MRITKFGHSCLLVEEGEAKILIDPGRYCFIEGKMQPEDFPDFGALLITHEHLDHCDLEALPRIISNRKVSIFTNASVAAALREHGFESQVLAAGEETTFAGTPIKAVEAPHGLISEYVKIPENTGFLLGGRFLHPGDSLVPDIEAGVEILAVPVVAPWLAVRESLQMAKRLRPRVAIPIHDSIIKDWVRSPYENLEKEGKSSNFIVREIKWRESIEV